MATRPLFAASREAAAKIMAEPLRFETTDDGRIRDYLANIPRTPNGDDGYFYSHEEIDLMLQHYHTIETTRKHLNL